MFFILLLGTFLVVTATLLPVFKCSHWFFRGMDFPRVQILLISASLLIADSVFLDFNNSSTVFLMFSAAICLFYQLWWVLPYTVIWPIEVQYSTVNDKDNSLSIITSNVLKTNKNSRALVQLVDQYQPDILVTLESDLWWEKELETLAENMPFSVKCPLDNLYGMHVYSKLSFSEEEICYLVEDGVPSIHVSLELRSGQKVRVYFVHPAPPSPTENTESTERDVELFIIAKSVAESNGPVIVTGDLNDVAWSKTTRLFRKISRLLDPRVGRGMFNTFHVDYKFLRWPLDHIFHTSHFKVNKIQRLPSIGSDHFPLFTTLVYCADADDCQVGLVPTASDHKDAEITIDKKNATKSDVPVLDE